LDKNMIEIKNVSKWYGPVQVLTDCSVNINKGDVVVVCGPSGSGKSTLIKTVNGWSPMQKGEIYGGRHLGLHLTHDRPAQAAQPRGHGVPAL
jgi:ABC-type polar amino acid transport system ATPase subunit